MDKLAPVTPSDAYLLNKSMKATAFDVNCHRVGRIVKFYPEDMTCDVELLELKPNITAGETNYALLLQLPLLVNGTVDSYITHGDIVGSECLVHFNDRDIDNWYESGEPYRPNSARLHNMSDGFVELRPFSKPNVIDYDTKCLVIKKGEMTIKLDPETNIITITNGTGILQMSEDTVTITGKLVVSDTIDATGTITSAEDCISGTISGKSHVHGGVQAGGGTTTMPQGG